MKIPSSSSLRAAWLSARFSSSNQKSLLTYRMNEKPHHLLRGFPRGLVDLINDRPNEDDQKSTLTYRLIKNSFSPYLRGFPHCLVDPINVDTVDPL
jgi:hypothetical protein